MRAMNALSWATPRTWKTRAATAVVLALSATFAPASRADDAPALVQAQASLSNLRYRLVDLDLGDGISASVSFSSPSMGCCWWTSPATGMVGMGGFQYHDHQGLAPDEHAYGSDPLPNPFLNGVPRSDVAWGGAQIMQGSGTLGLNHTILATPQQVRKLTELPGWLGQNSPGVTWLNREAVDAVLGTHHPMNAYNEANAQFVLSPNTALIIEGDASVIAQARASDFFANDTLNQGLGRGLQQAAGFATSSLVFSVGGQTYSKTATSRYTINGLEGFTESASGASGTEAFSLTFSNATGGWVTSGFGAEFALNSGVAVQVPEPTTWALVLSGLALAGLSARRRQAA